MEKAKEQMEKEEWNIIRTFEHPGQVNAVSFNRNATILATGSNGKIYLFNIDDNKELLSFDNKEGAGALSLYQNLIAIGSGDGIARVSDVNKPKKIDCFQNKNVIKAIQFNNDGNLLLVAGSNTARLFDRRAHTLSVSIPHEDKLVSACFKNDDQVITASFDTVRLFDIRKIEDKTIGIEKESVNRTNRYIMAVLTNADKGIVTLETPFITVVNENNWIPTKREPGDTLQIFNDITKKTIDTGIGATIDPSGYQLGAPVDRFFEREALLFSIALHPERALLAFGINDTTNNELRGKAVIFARKNQ
jgi:WD40 repeat protein